MTANKLKDILDSVRNQKDLQPHDGITYCNIAIDRTLALCGLPRMINKLTGQPLMANDMCDLMRDSFKWRKINGDEATARANMGILAIACQRGDHHGHVAAVYPQKQAFSPSWGKYVPMLSNVGKKNAVMRASQCFRTEPDYYSV